MQLGVGSPAALAAAHQLTGLAASLPAERLPPVLACSLRLPAAPCCAEGQESLPLLGAAEQAQGWLQPLQLPVLHEQVWQQRLAARAAGWLPGALRHLQGFELLDLGPLPGLTGRCTRDAAGVAPAAHCAQLPVAALASPCRAPAR